MSHRTVTMVRVYLTEKDHKLDAIVHCLHDELKLQGVTVLRAVEGYGASRRIHGAGLIDMSLNLPLVVEFFDRPERVRDALARIQDFVGPGHVVTWSAELNIDTDNQ
jgi:PII-like signaling protein